MPEMRIILRLKDDTLHATLSGTPAAAAFAAMLPLTFTLNDYAATEKIADLPAELPLTGAPEGHGPRSGDIAYYAPWGNLAIFYKDAPYAKGLVLLGRIEGDVALLRKAVRMVVASARG